MNTNYIRVEYSNSYLCLARANSTCSACWICQSCAPPNVPDAFRSCRKHPSFFITCTCTRIVQYLLQVSMALLVLVRTWYVAGPSKIFCKCWSRSVSVDSRLVTARAGSMRRNSSTPRHLRPQRSTNYVFTFDCLMQLKLEHNSGLCLGTSYPNN
jgi:hypothetical protein